MSLWAVESLGPAQAVAVQSLLDRLRPSLAILGDPRRPTGAATLLDAEQGLFVAHRDAVQGDTVDARLSDGRLRLKVLSRDARTGLVTGVDRGRYAVLVAPSDDDPERMVVAMKARELGRERVVPGDRVDLVGDLSGEQGSLALIVRIGERRTVLRRTADDTDPV